MFQLLLALLVHTTTSHKDAKHSLCLVRRVTKEKREGNLEKGTVGALSPQALRAGFVLAVRLVDPQVFHLQRKLCVYVRDTLDSETSRFWIYKFRFKKNKLTRSKKQRPTSSGQSLYASSSLRNILDTTMWNKLLVIISNRVRRLMN